MFIISKIVYTYIIKLLFIRRDAMNYFHKLYYTISSSEERDRMVKERYNYHSTIKTGLEIKPMDQPKKFELFYVPTNNTMNLIQEIMSNDKELDRKYNMLPGIA